MVADKESVFSKLNEVQNLPTIPEVMFDAISAIKTQPGNVIKIAEIVGKDQGISTKILSVANSPLYGMLRKVSNLEFAIMIMGTTELQNIITAISLSNAVRFKSIPNFNEQDYWKHSMAVGLLSKDIARKIGLFDLAGDAFVGGMLHDIGVQLEVKYFPEEFQTIHANMNDQTNFTECENKILGMSHQEIGGFLLNKWSLPHSIIECVEAHHAPQLADHKELVSIIHVADYITHKFQKGTGNWDHGIEFDPSVFSVLDFPDEESLVEFCNDYEEIIDDTINSIDI